MADQTTQTTTEQTVTPEAPFDPFGEVMDFEITAEDIASGIKCSNTDCPLARAFKRTFPEIDYVEIHNNEALLRAKDGRVKKMDMGGTVRKLVREFDETGTMKPIKLKFSGYGDRASDAGAAPTRP